MVRLTRSLRSLVVLAVSISSLAILHSATPAEAAIQTWTGRVTVVEDGDTFYVDVGGTLQHIRVAGVNTNETNRLPKCYADEATVRLRALIEGRTVELRANNSNSTADGRLVRHVFHNGQNMAELMLREGYGTPLVFLEQGEPDYAADYITAYAEGTVEAESESTRRRSMRVGTAERLPDPDDDRR